VSCSVRGILLLILVVCLLCISEPSDPSGCTILDFVWWASISVESKRSFVYLAQYHSNMYYAAIYLLLQQEVSLIFSSYCTYCSINPVLYSSLMLPTDNFNTLPLYMFYCLNIWTLLCFGEVNSVENSANKKIITQWRRQNILFFIFIFLYIF
jgi:hypothetical protein